MSTQPEARVRLSLQTGEFEVAGSEDFIAQYSETIESLSKRLRDKGPAAAPPAVSADRSGRQQTSTETLPADEFPEAMHQLHAPSGTDQILLAGKYAAANGTDGTFRTRDTSAMLIEQGIKLSNPSQSMADNLKAKRVFKVGKNWKISKAGEDYLRTLLS